MTNLKEDYRGSSARPLAHDAHDVQDLATDHQAVSGETMQNLS